MPASRGELSDAALAAFVQLGQHDGNLTLEERCPAVVNDGLGVGGESGELVWASLAGAEPVLLAVLAAHWSAPDKEPDASKRLRQQG
jgi:hypothetical protein